MGMSAPTLLRGRSSELEAIDAVLTHALTGRGGAVLLEGPAGIGKTTLLRAASTRAADQGFMVLDSCADELETDAEWGVALRLFSRVVHDDDSIFGGAAALARPLLTQATATEGVVADEFHVFHGLYWLTAALAERAPLAVMVDDVHWADPLSRRFIHYLLRRMEGLRVAVFLACRTGEPIDAEAPDVLGRFAVVPGVTTERVPPLTDDVVESMVRSDLPNADPSLRASVVAAVAGNPFLYHEVIGALQVERAEARVNDPGVLDRLPLHRVRDTVRVRLSRLGSDAAKLAAATSVLGSGGNPSRAARLAGVDGHRAVDAIDALIAADVLAPSGMEFVHPIVRQVVYADIGDARRRTQHMAAAEILHREGAPAAEVASHLIKADPMPASWAVDCLRKAAAGAYASGASTRAANLVEHALVGEPHPTIRSRLLLDLGRYEVAAGRASAVTRLQEALALVPQEPDHADVAWQLGDLLYGAGRFGDAVQAYARGLELAAARPASDRDPFLEARLVAGLHTSSLLLGSPSAHAVARIEDLVDSPPAAPSLAERTILASAVGACALGQGLDRARVLLLADLVLSGKRRSDVLTRPLLEPVAAALIMCDQFDRASGLLDEFILLAQRQGEIVAYASLLPIRAYASLCRGRLSEAITDASDALRLADDFPPASQQALAPARLVLALAALARGEVAAADDAVDVPDAALLWGETPLFGWYLYALGHVHMSHGRFELAREAFLDAGRSFDTGGGTGSFCAWRSGAAQALHALGDPHAHALVDTELRLARGFGSPRAIAVSLRCQARLATSAERAAELLAEARELMTTSEAELERAGIEVELGAALRRSGHRRDARTPLRQGMDLARRIGAWSIVSTAAGELEASGARRPTLSISGVDALTPAERRVARMAAGGQSNREIAQELFVTRKTVEVHLTSVYRKLGISSRAELPTQLT